MQTVVGLILAFIPVVSEVVAPDAAEGIAKYGLLGMVLAWFMLRADKRLGNIEHSLQGLRRTMLMDIFTRPTTGQRAKQICREEMGRVDPDLVSIMTGDSFGDR